MYNGEKIEDLLLELEDLKFENKILKLQNEYMKKNISNLTNIGYNKYSPKLLKIFNKIKNKIYGR